MQCLTPFYRTDQRDPITMLQIAFPCGACPECKKRYISSWSFRLRKEDEVSLTAFFVTLTYSNENLNFTKKGYMTLSKTDPQKFLKRLRKYHEKQLKTPKHYTYHNRTAFSFEYGLQLPTRYYICGEYGSETNRPHYHLLIFNSNPRAIEKAWINPRTGYPLGTIHLGTVTGASIGYTLKYMCKEHRIPMHKNDDRQPEFSLKSKGLGKNYLGTFEKQYSHHTTCISKNGKEYQRPIYKDVLKEISNTHKWHHADINNRMLITLEEGKKIAMPRYYKNKIYTDEQRKQIGKTIAKTTSTQIVFRDEKHRLETIRASIDRFKQTRLKTSI